MSEPLDDPQFWRWRAEEARTTADDLKHGETKVIMLAADHRQHAERIVKWGEGDRGDLASK
jgi:hypothetical protein